MASPAAGGAAGGGLEVFEAYFQRADLDRDGRISGSEAVAFLRGSSLPQQVLAQVWEYADQKKAGFLGRQEFFNALKLVTVAQSGHALTPEIVKSALYGQAAGKIPAPKITTMTTPGTAFPPAQTNSSLASRPLGQNMFPTSNQTGALPPTQYMGPRGPVTQSINMNQQVFPSNVASILPAQGALSNIYQAVPSSSLQSSVTTRVLPGAGGMGSPSPASTSSMSLSSDWLGTNSGLSSVGGAMQVPPKPTTTPRLDGFISSVPSTMGFTAAGQNQSNTSPALPASTSITPAGGAKQDSKAIVPIENGFSSTREISGDLFSSVPQTVVNTPASSFSSSTTVNTSNFTSGMSANPNIVKQAQFDGTQSPIVPPGGNQPQQVQSAANQNHLLAMQSISGLTASSSSVGPSNSAASQWPKISQSDVQKYTKVFQDVDKDRDGKITGPEARNLFLSWRLPRDVLKQVWDLSDQDNDGMLSLREFCISLYLMERHRAGTPLPTMLPDSVIHDETLLRSTGLPAMAFNGPAWQQNAAAPPRFPGAPVLPGAGARPPLPPHMNNPLAGGPTTKPGLPKTSMPAAANHVVNQTSRTEQSKTKVDDRGASDTDKKGMDNQLLDSREKLEYYRTKMQDLVLYKSRCDNRLNEITERAIADKREVESLAKKYEEKYKQVGELASKLAVEDAAFRDVQERKLELQNAIIKMEQGGSADGLLQVRADRIQYQLEELEKALNDRCKHFGLDVKPMTSIELPFGWEPGVQEGSLDWDEDWDKFEDEGFGVVKDNGTIENLASPDKQKTSAWNDDERFSPFSPSPSSNGHFKDEKQYRGEPVYEQSEEGSARSPSSPGRSARESPFVSSQFGAHDVSPHGNDNYSEYGGAEGSVFGDRYGDEQAWNFDDTDTESIWGPSAVNTFDDDHKSSHNSFYRSGDFRVDSPGASSNFGRKKSPFFDDSVPTSPSFTAGFSPKFGDYEDNSFNNFGTFDSFKSQDAGASPPTKQFSRFDSVNSSVDGGSFAQDQLFSRFDSMNSSKGESFQRFDSVSSSRNLGHSRFDSFDDSDPFGSTGPFKASGSRSPTKY